MWFWCQWREHFVHYSPFVGQHDERHEPGFKQLSHVTSLQLDSRAVGRGLGVWSMLSRNPYSPFTFAIKSRRVDQGGVNTREISCTQTWKSTSHWQVNLDAQRYSSGRHALGHWYLSLSVTTTGAKSIGASLSLVCHGTVPFSLGTSRLKSTLKSTLHWHLHLHLHTHIHIQLWWNSRWRLESCASMPSVMVPFAQWRQLQWSSRRSVKSRLSFQCTAGLREVLLISGNFSLNEICHLKLLLSLFPFVVPSRVPYPWASLVVCWRMWRIHFGRRKWDRPRFQTLQNYASWSLVRQHAHHTWDIVYTRPSLPLPFGGVNTAHDTGVLRTQTWRSPVTCPSFAIYIGNQVDGEFSITGVNSAYYTGDFMYTNLESTSYRKVFWTAWSSNVKLYVSWTHHGQWVNCMSVEFVVHHLFQPRVQRRLQYHVQMSRTPSAVSTTCFIFLSHPDIRLAFRRGAALDKPAAVKKNVTVSVISSPLCKAQHCT